MYILLLTAYILSNVKALSLLQMIGILPYTQKVTRPGAQRAQILNLTGGLFELDANI